MPVNRAWSPLSSSSPSTSLSHLPRVGLANVQMFLSFLNSSINCDYSCFLSPRYDATQSSTNFLTGVFVNPSSSLALSPLVIFLTQSCPPPSRRSPSEKA
jgi:hypothetical protein